MTPGGNPVAVNKYCIISCHKECLGKSGNPAEICQCALNNNRCCTNLLGGRLRPTGRWGRRQK